MREGKAATYLGAELESIVLSGQRITLPPWPDGNGWEFADAHYDDTEASQGTSGSNNWSIEAWGCRYSVDFRERGWDREKEAGEFFARAATMFLGLELDSTVYTYMQAHAVLEVAHVSRQIGAVATHRKAMNWLRYLAARCELMRSTRTRRILTVGDRSAALLEPGERCWQDHFCDIGMGRRSMPSELILTRRAPYVLEAFAEPRSGAKTPLDVMRELGFRTLVPLRVVEWDGGKAVFRVGSRWHPSTQPVAAAREVGGVEHYAPDRRGYTGNTKDRTHRANGVPTVLEHATSVEYQSPVYRPVLLSLPPAAERTLDVEVGGPEIVRDLLAGGAPNPAPGPPAPPRPDPVPPGQPGELAYLGRGGLPGELLIGSRAESTVARLRPIHGDPASGWARRWVVEVVP